MTYNKPITFYNKNLYNLRYVHLLWAYMHIVDMYFEGCLSLALKKIT